MKIKTLNIKNISWDIVLERAVIRLDVNGVAYEITEAGNSLYVSTIDKSVMIEPRASNSIIVSAKLGDENAGR